jgi:glucose-1-phosphate cytidylyltransferase
MKVVILAGGKGSRISEESVLKPKPMIEIGGMPILWHIMKIYSFYGFHEFIVCCGYKGQMIKDYFIHYYMHQSDSTFSLANQAVKIHESHAEPWKVTLANTGLHTLTAGRILKIKDYIEDDEFLLTYGDGVSDVDITRLIQFHHENGKIATITTTQPPGRFGALKIDETTNTVSGFKEKARADQAWVNAGFMVLNRKIFDYLGDGSEMLEAGPLEAVARDGEMTAYRHDGFWSPMDTLRDKGYLEELWNTGKAPWKLWD